MAGSSSTSRSLRDSRIASAPKKLRSLSACNRPRTSRTKSSRAASVRWVAWGIGARSDQATRSSRWQCACRTPAVETVARLTPKSRATYFCEHRLRTASTMAWRWGGFPVGLLIVGSPSENAFTATPGAFRRLWHLAAEGIPPYHSPIKALRYRDIAIVFIAITLQRTFRNSLPPQQKRRDCYSDIAIPVIAISL